MRLLLLLLFFPVTLQAQNQDIIRVKYSKLATIDRSYNPLFLSESGKIEFTLIKLDNLTTKEIYYGIEVLIHSSEKEIVSRSLQFSNIGSLWSSSVSTTAKRINESGFIFLTPYDLNEIIEFLNDVIGERGGEQENNYELWSISIYDGLRLGMLQDDDSWEFIFNANDVEFTIDYDKGFDLLLGLSRWNDWLQEQETNN